MLTFNAAPDELQLFLEEAEEQLQLLDQDIVLLEKEGSRIELLQEIFRAAHTLKGSSGAIGHEKMAKLTHAMENVLDHLRRGSIDLGTELIDVLLQSLDGLRLLKEEVETLQDGGFEPDELVDRLDDIAGRQKGAEGEPASRSSVGPEASDASERTVTPCHPWERRHLAGPEAAETAALPGAAGDKALPYVEAAQPDLTRVRVSIAEDCPLHAARCLQVYLEASHFGEVIHCNPSLEAIESQEVGHKLEMAVHAGGHAEEMVRALESLPDIVEVALQQPELRAGESQGPLEPPTDSNAGAAPTPSAPNNGTATNFSSSGVPGSNGANGANGAKGGGLGKTVRIDVARLDDLMNLVGELVIDRTRLTQLGSQLQSRYEDEAVRDLTEASQHIGRIVDELQEGIMKARMLPVAGLFSRLPRVVRDLSQRFGKKIDFVMEGEETELDRSVIEELHDPLVHLLRNAVDHGIEAPEQRLAAGKPEVGCIKLSAMHRENRIVLKVEDDGAGIDPEKIRAVALARGALTPEAAERLSERETLDLIFAAGFSTAQTVTDVSGRGVGMDIVRTNIEKLNGTVTIDSSLGRGTSFTLELPLTLAIIEALMVGLGTEVLAIPLVSVVETLRVRRSEIQSINKRQAIQLRGSVLPLISLDKALGLPSSTASDDRVFVVAVRLGDQRAGLVVDSLLGELQVVVKSLGRRVGNLEGITGATILGDGRVALILDIPSLVKCILEEQLRGA